MYVRLDLFISVLELSVLALAENLPIGKASKSRRSKVQM